MRQRERGIKIERSKTPKSPKGLKHAFQPSWRFLRKILICHPTARCSLMSRHTIEEHDHHFLNSHSCFALRFKLDCIFIPSLLRLPYSSPSILLNPSLCRTLFVDPKAILRPLGTVMWNATKTVMMAIWPKM